MVNKDEYKRGLNGLYPQNLTEDTKFLKKDRLICKVHLGIHLVLRLGDDWFSGLSQSVLNIIT